MIVQLVDIGESDDRRHCINFLFHNTRLNITGDYHFCLIYWTDIRIISSRVFAVSHLRLVSH